MASTHFPNHHFSSLLCAAGIGRTAQAAPGTGAPAKTACRETYGLLLYAGVAQSEELYRANGYAIECHWSLVRVQPSAPRPKADSVQGLKAGKPLPAGCVQICPVSKAQLWERPFDLPALNRALLRMRGPLSSGRIRKRGTRRRSSIGRAPRQEGDAGSNPAVCTKRGEPLPLAMGKAHLKMRQ